VLAACGARISEVLALTPAAIYIESGVVSLRTLKRRKRGVVRQVPLPDEVLDELDREFGVRDAQRDPDRANERIWTWSRTTAWRRVKEIMAAAGISGASAMPKGLRHGFGVNAFQSNVPPHLVQRWLGHASLRTTSIYGDVIGPDERAFAARMWTRNIRNFRPLLRPLFTPMKKPTDPLDQLIGRNIRLHRIRRGLSQTALDDRIGVSFQQVQKYENAANRVPASRLVHIARVLDMPMDAFFGHEAEAVGSPDAGSCARFRR
jgi:integrase/recombinase XerD